MDRGNSGANGPVVMNWTSLRGACRDRGSVRRGAEGEEDGAVLCALLSLIEEVDHWTTEIRLPRGGYAER